MITLVYLYIEFLADEFYQRNHHCDLNVFSMPLFPYNQNVHIVVFYRVLLELAGAFFVIVGASSLMVFLFGSSLGKSGQEMIGGF